MVMSHTIKNRFGEKLEGLYRSANTTYEHNPIIVFVPGFDTDLHENKNSFDEIAETLIQKGFSTFQFSFAGTGKSEGDFFEMTLTRQSDQIEDVLHWVIKQTDIDRKRIGLVAQSFGVASSMPIESSLIKSQVYISGAYFPYKSMNTVFSKNRGVTIHEDSISKLSRSSGKDTSVGPGFWKSIKECNTLRVASKIHISTMVIHGDLDRYVSVDDAVRTFNAISSKHKQLKIFEGGDHGIVSVPKKIRIEFLENVLMWFKETL